MEQCKKRYRVRVGKVRAAIKTLTNGIIKGKITTLRLVLGTCPTPAVTSHLPYSELVWEFQLRWFYLVPM